MTIIQSKKIKCSRRKLRRAVAYKEKLKFTVGYKRKLMFALSGKKRHKHPTIKRRRLSAVAWRDLTENSAAVQKATTTYFRQRKLKLNVLV